MFNNRIVNHGQNYFTQLHFGFLDWSLYRPRLSTDSARDRYKLSELGKKLLLLCKLGLVSSLQLLCNRKGSSLWLFHFYLHIEILLLVPLYHSRLEREREKKELAFLYSFSILLIGSSFFIKCTNFLQVHRVH